MDTVDIKIKRFFGQYRLRNYDKGETLIQAGRATKVIFFLEKGIVAQQDITPKGHKIVINIFKPGAFFPISQALDPTDDYFYFEALEEVSVRLCPVDDALNFLSENPDVQLDLLKRVYRGTSGLLRKQAQLMGGSAASRVIWELISSCYRFGEPKGTGYSLKINEVELSRQSGLARETVNREMAKLKNDNYITVHNQTVEIADIAQLERLVN